VTKRWVLNASPVIVLARIGYENLFFELAEQVVIPRAVVREIQAGPEMDPARQVVSAGKFTLVDAPSSSAELAAWDLGAGETAVLAFAKAQAGWTAILDDAAARRCARSFSIPVKGTLAIVLLAKQQRLIDSAADILHSLRAIGFHLSDSVIREALHRTVDENW